MPIGIGSGLWAYVAPIDAANIHTNPSFEFGTFGVAAIQGAVLGSTSQFQRFGAWSLKVTPSSNGTSGALLGTYTTGNGTTYSVSVWALVDVGVPIRFGIGDGNGLNLQTNGTTTFTGGGTWAWYTAPALSESGVNTRGVVLQKSSGISQAPIYIDGVMVNPWTDGADRTITYFDGDTGGGTWQGQQHQSISTRTGQYRGGGSIVALADIGLQVDQMIGVGVAPVENSSQSYAITDGAQFQRTRTATRKFTLTAKPIVGTSLADFHNTRDKIWTAIKPDLVSQQQPVRLLYYGAQGTQYIDAYYEKGLELGNMDGIIAENAAISFSAYDPYWYAPVQQGTVLSPRTSLGSVNFMAKRSPLGKWGTLGANGTTIGWSVGGAIRVQSLLANSAGTLFVAGLFGTIGGTFGPMIGVYNTVNNTFGTLQGGTLSNTANGVQALALNPNGTLFFGGLFTNIAGTNTNLIGQWTGAFGTLTGGTLSPSSGQVISLNYSPLGSLLIGGVFGTAGGTLTGNFAFWNGVYGSFGGSVGASNESLNAIAWGLDNQTIFLGGNYGNVGGTRGTSMGFYKNGAFGTMGDAISASGGGIVNALQVAANGALFEGGLFDRFGVGSANNVAFWNGVQQQPLGNGVNNLVHSMATDPVTGNILFGGSFSQVGSIKVASSLGIWNNSAWLLPDISVPPQNPGTVWTITYGPDNTLYIGGDFSGTAYCASVGTIVNTGRAAVYPVVRYRNLSASGTARLYQLVNSITGAGIYFNYTMLPGEQAFLNLQPGSRSFQSSARGNIFGVIIPGSNLATFSLLPGTNYISFFSDQDSLETSFFWQPRGWSVDSGTVL